jgi:hypothetical protein
MLIKLMENTMNLNELKCVVNGKVVICDASNVKVKIIPARVSNKKPFMDIQDILNMTGLPTKNN